ncbi:hypothetical protein THRCLA_07319, partial [Thraustotheca clavata]
MRTLVPLIVFLGNCLGQPCDSYTPLGRGLDACVSYDLPGPNTPHVAHTSSTLTDKLVIIGGYSISTGQPVTTNTIEVYGIMNSTSTTFPTLSIASGGPKINTQQYLPGSRVEHTTVTWEDGYFIYAGTNTQIMGDLWRLCLANSYTSGTWDQIHNTSATTYLPAVRTGHTTTTLSSNATANIHLVFGGTLANTYVNTNDTYFMVLVKSATGTVCQVGISVFWQPVSLVPSSPLPKGRSYHSMILNTNNTRSCFVLYGGQSYVNNTIFNDVWTLCPVANLSLSPEQQMYNWTQLQQLGSTPPPRFGHAMISSYQNRFLVVGGSYLFPADYMNDAWEFNMALQRWAQMPLSYTNGGALSPRRLHSMNYWAGNTLIILGGVGRYALISGNAILCNFIASQCPSGSIQMFCDASGQIVCQPCAAGYYAPFASASCMICPAGTYSTAGSSMCTGCPLGTYSSNPGAPSLDSCINCPAGTYSSAPNATSPSNWTFSSQAGMSACTPCSPGYYSNSNSSSCSICPAGTYSLIQATRCTNCTAGTYSPVAALGSCLSCPLGMYSNDTSTFCSGCPAGTFGSRLQAALSNCLPCPAGSYSSRVGQPYCTNCPDGTFGTASGGINATACKPCIPGTFSNANTSKAGACTSCAIGTFNSVSGSASCIPCSTNMFTASLGANSSSFCTYCPVGTQLDQRTSTCQSCPPGTHSLITAPGCVACPYGTFTNNLYDAQNYVCKPCTPMTFANTTGSTLCQPCPSGQYSMNQWSSCIPCTLPCPVGRNGGICSYHGTCSYGGCKCDTGFFGYSCHKVGANAPSNISNASGVIYFATANQTILYDNLSNSVLLGRDGGNIGYLSVLVSVIGGNGTATNGGLPVAWSTIAIFSHLQSWLNITLPIQSAARGCYSVVLGLDNLKSGASNISVTNSFTVTLLVQATAVPSTIILNNLVPTSSGYTISVLVSNQQVSSFSFVVPSILPKLVETYLYFDSNMDMAFFPFLPAVIASLQSKYSTLGVDWRFITNFNTNSPFGYDTSSFIAAIQAITLLPPPSPFDGTYLSNPTSLSSLAWTPGAIRTLVVFTTATSIGATTTATAFKLACLASNVAPYFVLPTASVLLFGTFAAGFGIVKGFNLSTFVDTPWLALQVPVNALVSITTNPTNGLLQAASWNGNSLTLNFRSANIANDPLQMISTLTILGMTQVQVIQFTFAQMCTPPASLMSISSMNGWVVPFDTTLDLTTQWLPSSQGSGNTIAPLDTSAQAFIVSGQNISYVQAMQVQLEAGTPIVVAGYASTPGLSSLYADTINIDSVSKFIRASLEVVVVQNNAPVRFLAFNQLMNSSLTWQFFSSVITLPYPTTQLQLVLNATSAAQFNSLGVFPDGNFSCSCGSGYYMRNQVCTRCPSGSACAAGMKQPCIDHTFSFGAFSVCKPCYQGWTCSGGLATPCPPGMYSVNATSCLRCSPGYSCFQGLRKICGVGTFALAGASKCSRCLPGTFANTSGSPQCSLCSPGMTSNYMRDHCIPCSPGSISSQPGSFPCNSCQLHTFASAGQASCSVCPPGFMTPTKGSQQCQACPPGSNGIQ